MTAAVIELAEIDLEDLEVAAALLGPAGTFQKKNRETARAFAAKVVAAARAGHRIAIVGRGAKRLPPAERWRVPIIETPQPWRGQALAALAAVMDHERVPLERVDYLL